MEKKIQNLIETMCELTNEIRVLNQSIINNRLQNNSTVKKGNNQKKRPKSMTTNKVTMLKCKNEVIKMRLEGKHTLNEIAEYVKTQGESITKSSLSRYFIDYLVSIKLEDGVIEIVEKSGNTYRIIKGNNIEIISV